MALIEVKEYINYNNILNIYDNIISKNIKHKKKLNNFEKNKIQNINIIINILKSNNYEGGRYEIFLISEPKLTKYLGIRNIATRKNMGTDYGIKLILKYLERNKKYNNFYCLKMDISKYFYSIDHEVLLSMLKDDLNFDEYNLIKTIINSTNKDYINKEILKIKENSKKIYKDR